MDRWEIFDETTRPNKKDFYNEFNLEDITYKDYAHAQKVFEQFKSRNLGDYQELYVQSDTLLLADILENFRNKCIEIYELDPVHFFFFTWISMASVFKKYRSRIKIINRYRYVTDGSKRN